MIPTLFLIFIAGGVIILIGRIILKGIVGKQLERDKERQLKRIQKLEDEVGRMEKTLPHEDDIIDESEETNEARGLPSSAVMDEEDE